MTTDRSLPRSGLEGQRRYATAAIILHWAISALIVIQIGLGWYFNEVSKDHSAEQDYLTSIHISVGLTILLLVVVRIAVRLTHRPPPLPAGMPRWERLLANAGHLLFYILLLVLPLSGWALVSAGKDPISFWGIPWPHLPGVAQLLPDRAARKTVKHLHVFVLIWIILANLVLHIAGALKHQFDGRPVLWRMVPFLKGPAAER